MIKLVIHGWLWQKDTSCQWVRQDISQSLTISITGWSVWGLTFGKTNSVHLEWQLQSGRHLSLLKWSVSRDTNSLRWVGGRFYWISTLCLIIKGFDNQLQRFNMLHNNQINQYSEPWAPVSVQPSPTTVMDSRYPVWTLTDRSPRNLDR